MKLLLDWHHLGGHVLVESMNLRYNNQDLVTISGNIGKLQKLKSNISLNGFEVLRPANTEVLQIVNKHWLRRPLLCSVLFILVAS